MSGTPDSIMGGAAGKRSVSLEQTDALSPTISIAKLNHFYGKGDARTQVLYDVNLNFYPGEIVIIGGPSGCGKTTLLTLVGTLRGVQDGSILLNGQELHGLSASRYPEIRRNVGFIFQAHNLFSSLSAFQNVKMGMELRSYSSAEMRDRITEILTLLGLGHRIHYKPAMLSGGQKQRVAIARALINHPKVILADEPTAALDKESGRTVVNLLRRFAEEEQATILLVTHDDRILDVADRIVKMSDGRVVANVAVGETEIRCNFLRKCKLFAELTPQTLTEVADKMSREKYPAGATIVRQGDEGDKFYVIRGGSVEVIKEDLPGQPVVAVLEEGGYFGEAALLKEQPRNATVRAKENVEVYSLGKADFRSVMDQSTTFADQIRAVLFHRH